MGVRTRDFTSYKSNFTFNLLMLHTSISRRGLSRPRRISLAYDGFCVIDLIAHWKYPLKLD